MFNLVKLGGELDRRSKIIFGVVGLLLILLLWYLLSMGSDPLVPKGILPRPIIVWNTYGDLFNNNELFRNICRSIGLNVSGYLEAVLFAIPVGFLLGLIPIVRSLFRQPIDALRFVPLPAVFGLFMALFGLGTGFKVHFLAFGIFIYLVPVVIQRIDEVDEVYLKTVYTLGATSFDKLLTVYIPSVLSRISDDIRVLTAISWTYIIIAESIGMKGGLGAMIWSIGQRQGRIEAVYALLLIIIVIGLLQDWIFVRLDKAFFPFKYTSKDKYRKAQGEENSVMKMATSYIWKVCSWIFLLSYVILMLNEQIGFIWDVEILTNLFGETAWVMNSIVIFILLRNLYKMFINNLDVYKKSTSRT